MTIGIKLGSQYRKLKLGVSVVDAQANITYVMPAADISYINLSVQASLDPENKNPYVTDTVIFTDAAYLTFGKVNSDSVLSADDSVLDFNKNNILLLEKNTTFEQCLSMCKPVNKPNLENIKQGLKDTIYNIRQKPIKIRLNTPKYNDNFTYYEIFMILFSKLFLNYFNTNDYNSSLEEELKKISHNTPKDKISIFFNGACLSSTSSDMHKIESCQLKLNNKEIISELLNKINPELNLYNILFNDINTLYEHINILSPFIYQQHFYDFYYRDDFDTLLLPLIIIIEIFLLFKTSVFSIIDFEWVVK